MIQIIYILRDNLQALDNEELEKIRINYNLTKGFLKHFDYLGIDTNAINEKMDLMKSDIIKMFTTEMNTDYKLEGKGMFAIATRSGLTKQFYTRNKQTIDKIITSGFYGNKYKSFIMYFDRCIKHTCVFYYDDNNVIKIFTDTGCPCC